MNFSPSTQRSSRPGRARLGGPLVLALALIGTAVPGAAQSPSPSEGLAPHEKLAPHERLARTPEYRAAVLALQRRTGSLDLGIQMANGIVESMLTGMRSTGETVPPEVERIIREAAAEFFEVFADEGEMVAMVAPIWAKHFTAAELDQLSAFYETPLGKKTIAAMPSILQESMALGQARALEVVPTFQAELQRRLEAAALAP